MNRTAEVIDTILEHERNIPDDTTETIWAVYPSGYPLHGTYFVSADAAIEHAGRCLEAEQSSPHTDIVTE